MATKKSTDNPGEEVMKVKFEGVPAHLQEYVELGALGFDKLRKEDTLIPRLAIAQAISPQVTKGDPLRIEGLEVGQYFNTVTGEIYGERILVTPLIEFPSRTLFPPRGSNEAPLCSTRTLDENGRLINGPITPQGCDLCPHSQWLLTPRPDGSTKPDCTFFFNYALAVHTEGGLDPVVFSVKSKMIKPAMKLNSLVRFRKPQLPGFCVNLELSTVPQKATKGTFFNLVVNHPNPENRNVSAQDLPQTKYLYDMFSSMEINVDMRGVDKEDIDEVDDSGDSAYF